MNINFYNRENIFDGPIPGGHEFDSTDSQGTILNGVEVYSKIGGQAPILREQRFDNMPTTVENDFAIAKNNGTEFNQPKGTTNI
jgi:hypothetical protein